MESNEIILEKAIIGSCLQPYYLDADDSILNELAPEHFTNDTLATIFTVIKIMKEAGKPIDYITIGDELEKCGQSVAMGHIRTLNDFKVTPELAKSYISIMKRNKHLRKIGDELKLLNPQMPQDKIQDLAKLVEARDSEDKKVVLSLKDMVEHYCKELKSKKYAGIPTGFRTLDGAIHPQVGDLEIIGARTNVGKTVCLTNILVNMLNNGIECLYCPTEMKPYQFIDRLIPLIDHIQADKFRSREFTPNDHHIMANLPNKLKKLKLNILDIASPTIFDIKQAVKTSGCKVLLLDYLGRCSMPREATRMREIERFMVDLKTLCLDYNVLCFLAVQLSRATDFNKDSAPRLADLSDSSAIEKEADSVTFLWRDPKSENTLHTIDISAIIAKNRHGRLDKFQVNFNTESLKMSEQGYIAPSFTEPEIESRELPL